MKVTREVITDLLPLYLAGEASEDSKLLVQKFLEQDPEFAQLVALSDEDKLSFTAVPFPNTELATLTKTKRLLHLRGWLFGIALFLTASLFSLRFIDNDVTWLSTGFTMGLNIALVGSWVAYAIIRRRLNNVGL